MSDSISRDGQQLPGSHSHPNPMFDFLSGYVPRKLKDLFRWTEYLYFNSPHIFQALTKMSQYVITDIRITTDATTVRDHYVALHKSLRLIPKARAIARDKFVYGNVFVSLHFPFKRMLRCNQTANGKTCGLMTEASRLDYAYDHKKTEFKWTCPECNQQNRANLDDKKQVIDIRSHDQEDVNIIRWDPKLIDIDHNPITDESDYYYSIPASLKSAIAKGHRHTVSHMPKAFLQACREGYSLKLDRNNIFHAKVDAPAGVEAGWGLPPLTALMKQFYYTQVLRKANEAIALDHLTPFRVLHPQATSGANDPVQTQSLATWVDETKKNIKQWRRDPLHIMFAPVALGVTQMGGQGRTLMTLGEVQDAENNIMAGMGLPREFLYGGLSVTAASVTLRMLENQLGSHKADMDEFVQWVDDKCAAYFGYARIEAEFVPFKFVDDVQQKSMEMGINAQYDLLSKRSIYEALGRDMDEEIEQKTQEILDQAKRDAELEAKLSQQQESLSAQVAQAQSLGAGLTYDPQAVQAEAQNLAEQLLGLDPGLRRSHLHQLQTEDYVMYSVVIQVLESINTTQRAEMRAEAGI